MSRETTLVTAQWVEEHLDDPSIVLVEVDEDTTAYDKGHIRGAIKLDWTTDLQDQVRRDFVNKAQFEQLLSSRGVSNDHTVVLYGGTHTTKLADADLLVVGANAGKKVDEAAVLGVDTIDEESFFDTIGAYYPDPPAKKAKK